MNQQKDLFGNIIGTTPKKIKLPKKEQITLSFSKAQVLDQCNLKYYYHYYGSNKKKKSIQEPNKEELWKLKKLSNYSMLMGQIIHDTIEIFFKKARKGEEWEYEQLIWLATKKLTDSIKYSKNYEIGQIDNLEYPPTPLKEIVLMGMDAEQLKKEGVELIEKCFTNFCDSEDLKDFYWDEHIIETAIVEKRVVFEITEGVKIDGKVDLAYYDNNEEFFHIIDWKTGELDFEDTSLQLVIYAIWANQELGVPIEYIRIYKAYLQKGKLDQLRFDEYEIERAKAKIAQDFISRMNLLHPKGMAAKTGAFEPRKEKNICALCPFETVCYHKN